VHHVVLFPHPSGAAAGRRRTRRRAGPQGFDRRDVGAARDPALTEALRANAERFYALIRADVLRMRPAGGGISGTVVDAQTYAVLMFISGVMLTRSSGKDGCGRRRSWIAYSRESSQVLRCNMIRRRSLVAPAGVGP